MNELIAEASAAGIEIIEKRLRGRNRGLYGDSVIILDKRMRRITAKRGVLAEEIGHHHTTVGDILDQHDVRNRKQEHRARAWAYQRLVPLTAIIEAHKIAIRNRHELAEYLVVEDEFLDRALKFYTDKYGLLVKVGSYHICFEPLGVIEFFDF